LGKKFGAALPAISKAIQQLSHQQLLELQHKGNITISAEGDREKTWNIAATEVEIIWQFKGETHLESVRGDDLLVVLNVSISAELSTEALIREITRTVNKMRKEAQLHSHDAIHVYYESSSSASHEKGTTEEETPKMIDLPAAIDQHQSFIVESINTTLQPIAQRSADDTRPIIQQQQLQLNKDLSMTLVLIRA